MAGSREAFVGIDAAKLRNAVAVADDAPLTSGRGGSQGDGLEPRFSEPTD